MQAFVIPKKRTYSGLPQTAVCLCVLTVYLRMCVCVQVSEKQRLAQLVLQLQEDMEEMRTVSWGCNPIGLQQL